MASQRRNTENTQLLRTLNVQKQGSTQLCPGMPWRLKTKFFGPGLKGFDFDLATLALALRGLARPTLISFKDVA